MLRVLSGLVAVTIGLVLVGQGVGQDENKKPDLRGKITEVKKAAVGEKGLGTITINTAKKGEDAKPVTVKVGKKTEIMKFAGKDAAPTPAEFSDLKEGAFVGVWSGEEGKAAKKIIFGGGKKKKAAD